MFHGRGTGSPSSVARRTHPGRHTQVTRKGPSQLGESLFKDWFLALINLADERVHNTSELHSVETFLYIKNPTNMQNLESTKSIKTSQRVLRN
jgi:hypothetical protein